MTDREPALPIRPRAGCAFLAMPVLMALFFVVAYGALFLVGGQERTATGPEVTLTFTGCPEAEGLIEDRARAIGLGEPRLEAGPLGAFTLTARLPTEAEVADRVPETLARVGHFEIRALDGRVLAGGDDVASATIRLDWTGSPTVAVQVDAGAAEEVADHMEAHPEEQITFWIDGERVDQRQNHPPETEGRFSLTAEVGHLDRVMVAAEQAVILDHGPLPCPVEVEVTARGE